MTGRGAIWRIDGSGDTVTGRKIELLDASCVQVEVYVRHDEAPDEIPATRGAPKVARDTWQLPRHVPGAVVLARLHRGNWQLYVAAAPLALIPDPCRAADAGIEAFVRRLGAQLIIDSLHDDVA